ncbi:inactive peptidyl-prolyl cis-trans isomerase shutdown [Bicyclus anynana]|uniref:peptidylprolyl isomerase n=1 Tax=Bicyclus anynana TaxID=110368 RepID=A0A6J1PAB0_BICAN|nr:inactive peptidyl-prolyl cis-trans isomerase shutdown [Bicyclus anynana]
MNSNEPKIVLETGLDLRQLFTTGSTIHINTEYDDIDIEAEVENSESYSKRNARTEYKGEPVECFEEFAKHLTQLDKSGFIKKKILQEGGGLPLDKECTVSVAFTGYWENEVEPFGCTKPDKPMVVNLNDNDLLPGIQMAIESMLVGELSVFLISYRVMYGEMGAPPRIKAKADCVFFIQLIKSIITPKDGEIDFAEPNVFQRVHHKVKLLFSSGVTLHKSKNYPTAIQLFKKGINMLHRCRLADEKEENIQIKLLRKMYINLAISYNETKQPLKACTACNELNRLDSLWNNPKALFQNAKALRMIGQFEDAQKRLNRALKLSPDEKKAEILGEIALVNRLKNSCNQSLLVETQMPNTLNDKFKTEVDALLHSFKENVSLCNLTLPGNLNAAEMDYIKEACVRENLFCYRNEADYILDRDPIESKAELLST